MENLREEARRYICIEFRCYSLAGFLGKHLSSKFENSLLTNTLINVKIPSLAFSKGKYNFKQNLIIFQEA